MLINTLEGIANGSPALAEDLISAVHDPACTDWGSKILLDMQAIMLSHTLSDALLEHLSTSPQSAPEARLTQLEQFIQTHQKDFCALLNYSAFQSAANNADIIDPSNKESIEIYLLLYLDTKEHFPLPGKLTATRMNHVNYTIEHVLGGDSVFTEKRRAIGAVLRGAQGPLEEDHLNHLSDPFNLKIWNHVIAALPDNDVREAVAKSERSKLSAEMAALDEAHHNGHLSAEDYTAQSDVVQ